MYIQTDKSEWHEFPNETPKSFGIYTCVIRARLKYDDSQVITVKFLKELLWDSEYKEWRVEEVLTYGHERISDYIQELNNVKQQIPYKVDEYVVERFCVRDDSEQIKVLKILKAQIEYELNELENGDDNE